MSHYTGAVPTAARSADWRDNAACRDEDSELFFPKGNEGHWLLIIEQAKTICRRCPVADACLNFALTEGIPSGIFGGLTEQERAGLRRSVRRGRTAAEDVTAKAAEARQPRRTRTLQSLYDEHTTPMAGGHLAWTGGTQQYVNNRRYSPWQIAFIVGRGHEPHGPVRSDCGHPKCVLPAHLADMTERSACGTRNGYLRHRRNGEDACDRCRQANTDAEVHRTSAIKVAV